MIDQATVRDNLARVLDRIAAAALSCGRDPRSVTLVGVTKYVSAHEASLLCAEGCRELGESRPQELWTKAHDEALQSYAPKWHLIGHLQRNKALRTLDSSPLIHSVDSERLLRAIQSAADQLGATAHVLLEVNTSGDATKDGLTSDDARRLIEKSDEFPLVAIQGLMTMAAREGDLEVARGNFRALRELRDELQRIAPSTTRLDQLSMGMSGDYAVAISEGATLVRVGSALWNPQS